MAAINRRALIGALPAITATPALALALAAENIYDRTDRLLEELADALAEYRDGQFHAVVMPASIRPYNVMLVNTKSADATPIAALYRDWKAASSYPDEDEQAGFQLYRSLREAIISATPRTPADVARQLLAETDDGGSDFRECFLERIRVLAGEA